MKKYIVPVADLVPGMFVTDLDRPWLGTPFLLQGFHVDGADQIEELRRLCKVVTVDPVRSHCRRVDFTAYARDEQPVAPHDFAEEPDIAIENDDFYSAAYLVRNRKVPKERGTPPVINPSDGQSQLVAEMVYSASIVDDVQSVMNAIFASIENGVIKVTVRGKALRHPDLGTSVQEVASAWQGLRAPRGKVEIAPVRRAPVQLRR